MDSDIPGLIKIDTGKDCEHCGRRLYAQQAFGGIVIPMMCECQIEKKRKEEAEAVARKHIQKVATLRAESGLPTKQLGQLFSNFNIRQGTETAFNAAKDFVLKFPNVSKGIVFVGPTGTGKTHLAAAIANAVINREYTVRYIRAYDIIKKVRATFAESALSEDHILRPLERSSLLIIDDFGVMESTEWSKSVFQSIIDYRMNYEKPTIITTNLSKSELQANMDPRTFDRLNEGFLTFPLVCDSYRNNC